MFPLVACSVESANREPVAADGTSALSEALSSVARLRVVHASPDAPAVDVYVRGQSLPVASGLAFTDTTGDLRLKAGSYTVDVRATPSTDADAVVFSAELTLEAGVRTTGIASGSLASTDAASGFRILPVVERFAAASAGNGLVRIIHASPDAPSVSLDVGDDDIANPEVPNLDRFSDTGEAGIALPAGVALQVAIGAGGARQTAFTTPELPTGAGLLVIATGFLSHLPRERDGFGLLAVGPRGTLGFIKQNPTVYALHASPDAPAVRLGLASGPVVVNRLAFGELSAPLQVPPSAYELDVFVADGADAALTRVSTGPLVAGERYLAVAGGFLNAAAGGAGFGLSLYADRFTRGETEIQAIHASPDAPAVDVSAVDAAGASISLATDASFPLAGPVASISLAGEALFVVNVAPAGSPTPVASFSTLATPSERSFVLVAGALTAGRGAPLQLLSVQTEATPWHVGSIAAD